MGNDTHIPDVGRAVHKGPNLVCCDRISERSTDEERGLTDLL